MPLGGATRLRSSCYSQTVKQLPFLVLLSTYQSVVSLTVIFSDSWKVDSRAQKSQITFHLEGILDPWLLVKQGSRSSGSAIQPIVWSPGQSGVPAHAQDIPKASKMRAKAIPSSWNRAQKACHVASKASKASKQDQQSNHRIIEASKHRIIEFKGPAAGGEALQI